MTATSRGPGSGRPRVHFAWLRSLRGRIFLAGLLLGALPVIVFLSHRLSDAETYRLHYDLTSDNGPGASQAVLDAWAKGGNGTNQYDPAVAALAAVATMRERLSAHDFRALVTHVRALVNASSGSYDSGEATLAEMDNAGPSIGPLGRLDLRRLRRAGFFWGEGMYLFRDVFPPKDIPKADTSSGDSTPIVAWMETKDRVGYVRVFPQLPVLGGRPSLIDWRFVAVAGLAFGCVALISLIATLVGTRGAMRPVRRMAEESAAIVAGGEAATVPVGGPAEIRELATAFNTMAARTSWAQEAEQSFLLSVSHELKTPLTAIKGYGETLVEGRAEPRVAGEVITKEAGRLQRLVQDVLDLGRARKSSFSVRCESVDLAVVACEAGERYAERAREYGLDLKVEAPRPAFVRADGDRMLQVVSNLVENALRCTPADGSVMVTAAPGEVRVADTGPGLTRDDLARAFERFYLYERYGKEREVGTGLGLAIVRELTQAMGGSVEVESTLGEGTSFVIRLPDAGDAD